MIKQYFLAGILVCMSVLAKSQNNTPFINSGNLDTVLARKIINLPDSKFEIYPSFIGKATFETYISSNFITPNGLKDNFKGDVVASMLIDTFGNVSKVEILKGQNNGLDNETIRVLRSTKWKPAIYDFKHVNYNQVVCLTMQYDSLMGVVEISTQNHYSIHVYMLPSTANPSDKIFTAVESEPTFPGGINEFYYFLNKTIRYPKSAKENKIEGVVILSFVVDRDGSLTDLHILRSPDEAISLETLRVLKLCPKFKPGIQNRRPVRVQYSMPLTFSLKKT